jgi:hypothetical protein
LKLSKRLPLQIRFPGEPVSRWLPAFGLLALLPFASATLPAFPGVALRWLGLMLAPGTALYLIAERRTPRLSVLVLCALVLSPVVTTLLGIAGLMRHMPVVTIAGVISAASIAVAAIAFVTLRARVALPDRPSLLWLGALLLVLVVLTAFLPMTQAWWRIRSDAWFHGAVVSQIADYGIPPQDPYFAGIPLQYMWFYHVLVLVLARGFDMDPFRVMALLNIQALVALGVCTWQLCGVFRRTFAHRLAATAMMLLGFNGAFWVFLPAKLVRATMGDVRGWAEVKRTYSIVPFNYDQACGFMNIYYNQEFFLDKFMVATAFGLSLAFMVAGWYAASEYLRTRRAAPLVVLSGALAGMLGFHSLVGFVMLVGIFGGAILAWLTRGRDAFPMRPVLVLLGVSLASFAAMGPYLYEVMHLKQKEQVFPLSVSLHKTAGIFISCAFALVLALIRRPLLREKTVTSRFFLFGTLSVTAFCLLITLPGPNAYDKLGYLVFLPLSMLGGIALADLWLERTGGARRTIIAWTVACMVPVNAIAFAACFATPDEALVTEPEARISTWLRDNTPRNALVIDDDDRVVFLVTVPRRYIWGRTSYAQQWGYPRLEMSRRLHMRRALYAPGTLDATALEVLGEATEPVYAIVRPEHWRTNAAIVTQSELFQTVYKDDRLRVVRVDTQVCRALAARRTDHLSAEELIRESGF